MDLNHLFVTTVRPDAKATMQGSQGQKARKKKTLEPTQSQLDPMIVEQDVGYRTTPDRVDESHAPHPGQSGSAALKLDHSTLRRNDGRIGEDVDAWTELPEAQPENVDILANHSDPVGVLPSIEEDDLNDPVLIEPFNSSRVYVRVRGEQREVWKPGDGDGDEDGDWFGRADVLPKEHRWRVFQSNIGEISWKNENIPPKFVYLDDLAAHEVLESDIPKAKICQWWQHDFGQPCKIRRHRPHVGRPAIKNPLAEGNARYHSTQLGGKGAAPYYFSGDPEFVPVRYRIPPKVVKRAEPEAVRQKRKYDDILDSEPNRRAHGHNQYTPKDMLVKYGAPSMAKPVERHHNLPPLPKPHHDIKGGQNPIFTEKRLIGDVAQSARESVRKEARKAQEQALQEASTESLRAALKAREAASEHAEVDVDAFSQRHAKNRAIKHVSATGSPLAKPAASASDSPILDSPINVPRQLSYIERRDIENRMAVHVMHTIQNQDNVQAMARDLATEKVKVGQQEKEITLLKQQLQAVEHSASAWKQVAADKERDAADLEKEKVASVEDSKELKRKSTMLQLTVDRQNAELRRLRQQQ